MSEILLIIIYAAGVSAMFIELFIPGAIIGTLGFLAITGSIVMAFAQGQTVLGVVFILVTLASIPMFFALWKHVVARYMTVTGSEKDFRSGTFVNDDLIGKEGEATTSLHPTGIAFIDGMRYDVVTRGEMLDKGTKIKVIDVTGNRIVVTKKQ